MDFQILFKHFSNMVLAGVSISLGAFAYLHVGGVVGAVLFSIGLIGVLSHGLLLYTGVIKDVSEPLDIIPLVVIIVGNWIGCWLSAQFVQIAGCTDIVGACEAIVAERGDMGFISCFLMSAGCGWLVTLAAGSWKVSPLALLIGVPTFILSGMPHSIADAFYYAVGYNAISHSAIIGYVGVVLGNFFGGFAHKLAYPFIINNTKF